MSNYLSLAAVTATLANVIQEGFVEHDVNATVTHLRPNDINNNNLSRGVNAYLYQVTTNAAWRNADMPTRNSAGKLITRPRVALDLHYLLSFFGDESKLETQRFLGLTASTLHARSILTRDKIRSVIASGTYSSYLGDSNLADEVELVKFTPIPLSLEELSKLWSVFFQTQYNLSIAYQATVVLIDADMAPVSPLPVRTANFYTTPYQQIVVDKVVNSLDPLQPITPSDTIRIIGSGLDAGTMMVRIGDAEVTPATVSPNELTLDLTTVPSASLSAGVQGLQVVKKGSFGAPLVPGGDPAPHTVAESNVAPFVVRPLITAAITASTDLDDVTTITVHVAPTVAMEQRVLLLLNETASSTPDSYALLAPARDADGTTVVFTVKGAKAATFLARIQVDGAESLLTRDADETYNGPTVTLP
ncbi:MAG TPA: DUF4255 domain-containing protein [Candidatus Kapabacteria bacterium]|nr:DUF4255 domain-containing protein [Candidatus Kapabacteria bacterium]